MAQVCLVCPASRGFVSLLLKMVVAVVVMMVFVTVAPAKAQAPTCSLNWNEVKVMDNFDVTRYGGVWYGIWWSPPRDFNLDWVSYDYYEFYQINEDGNGMNGYSFGRDQKNAEMCYRAALHFVPTDRNVPAKMLITKGFLDSFDYWVLDTDYDSYAYIFGCMEKFANGTCGNFYMVLYSRVKTPLKQRMDQTKDKFEEFCMDMNRLAKDVHEKGHKGCHYPDAGTASKLMTSAVPLVTLLLACLLLNTRVLSP